MCRPRGATHGFLCLWEARALRRLWVMNETSSAQAVLRTSGDTFFDANTRARVRGFFNSPCRASSFVPPRHTGPCFQRDTPFMACACAPRAAAVPLWPRLARGDQNVYKRLSRKRAARPWYVFPMGPRYLRFRLRTAWPTSSTIPRPHGQGLAWEPFQAPFHERSANPFHQ